jgi:hypothetical protein
MEHTMTKSYIPILSRHSGAWRIYLAFAPDAKGRPQGAWDPERCTEPVDRALELLGKPGTLWAHVWSMSEQQFAFTVYPEDRATWEAERDNWRGKAKTMASETSSELAKAMPARMPSGIDVKAARKVLELRKAGLGYVAIETEMGITGKKGFWAWKIVKAVERGAVA